MKLSLVLFIHVWNAANLKTYQTNKIFIIFIISFLNQKKKRTDNLLVYLHIIFIPSDDWKRITRYLTEQTYRLINGHRCIGHLVLIFDFRWNCNQISKYLNKATYLYHWFYFNILSPFSYLAFTCASSN